MDSKTKEVMEDRSKKKGTSAEYCHLCEKQYHSENFRSHMRSRRHERIFDEAKYLAKHWVKISGTPAHLLKQDIVRNLFSKFGKILRIVVIEDIYYIRFLYHAFAQAAIVQQKEVKYKNVKLNVSTLFITPNKPLEVDVFLEDPENNSTDDFHSILSSTIEKLRNDKKLHLKSFDEMATDVVLPVLSYAKNQSGTNLVFKELTDSFHRWTLDVEKSLNINIKGGIHIFGSIEIGLALSKYSDMDIYIEMDASQLDMLTETVKILNSSDKFHSICNIRNARVPIVKCVHMVTDIPVDISFKSKLGWFNSQLIKYFVSLDPRVKTLLALVKMWFKKNDLNGTRTFTSYSVYWLVLFYLQQLRVPLIPSVEQILNTFPTRYCLWWKVVPDFSTPSGKVPFKSKNTSSIESLFMGFFKFYSSIDFSKVVICPLLGQTLYRDVFDPEKRSLNELPREMATYQKYAQQSSAEFLKVSSPMCIQDPYDLSHNITKAVNLSVIALFEHHIGTVLYLYEKYPLDVLIRLFEDINEERDARYAKYEKLKEEVSLKNLLNRCEEKARNKKQQAEKNEDKKVQNKVEAKQSGSQSSDKPINQDNSKANHEGEKTEKNLLKKGSSLESAQSSKPARSNSASNKNASFVEVRTMVVKNSIYANKQREEDVPKSDLKSTVTKEAVPESEMKLATRLETVIEPAKQPGLNTDVPPNSQAFSNNKLLNNEITDQMARMPPGLPPSYILPPPTTTHAPQLISNISVPTPALPQVTPYFAGTPVMYSSNNQPVPQNMSTGSPMIFPHPPSNNSQPSAQSIDSLQSMDPAIMAVTQSTDKPPSISHINTSVPPGFHSSDRIVSQSISVPAHPPQSLQHYPTPPLHDTSPVNVIGGLVTQPPPLPHMYSLFSPPSASTGMLGPNVASSPNFPFPSSSPLVTNMFSSYRSLNGPSLSQSQTHVIGSSSITSLPQNNSIVAAPITQSSLSVNHAHSTQPSNSENSVLETLKFLAIKSPNSNMTLPNNVTKDVSSIENNILNSPEHTSKPQLNERSQVKSDLNIDLKLSKQLNALMGLRQVRQSGEIGQINKAMNNQQVIDVAALEMRMLEPDEKTTKPVVSAPKNETPRTSISKPLTNGLKHPKSKATFSHVDEKKSNRRTKQSSPPKKPSPPENLTYSKVLQNEVTKNKPTAPLNTKNNSRLSNSKPSSNQSSTLQPDKNSRNPKQNLTRSSNHSAHIPYVHKPLPSPNQHKPSSNLNQNKPVTTTSSKKPMPNQRPNVNNHPRESTKPVEPKIKKSFYVDSEQTDEKKCLTVYIYKPDQVEDTRTWHRTLNHVLLDYLEKICRITIFSQEFKNDMEFVIEGKHTVDVCHQRTELLEQTKFDPTIFNTKTRFQAEIIKTNYLVTNLKQNLQKCPIYLSVNTKLVVLDVERVFVKITLINDNSKSQDMTSKFTNYLNFMKRSIDFVYEELQYRTTKLSHRKHTSVR